MTSPADLLKGTTKGPWEVDSENPHRLFIGRWWYAPIGTNPTDSDVAEFWANARLIAAAPDLARRLQEAEELIRASLDFYYDAEKLMGTVWDGPRNAPSKSLTKEWRDRAEAFLKEGEP